MTSENQSPIESDIFRTMIASSADGFTLVNASGCILDANDSYCQLVGHSRKELLGMHIYEIDAIETAEDVAIRSEEIFQKGSLRFETRHLRKDGSAIDVEVTATYAPLHGGSFFSIIRDISPQKQIEKNLQKSEKRYRSIVESQTEFVVRYLAGGILQYVNPALARFTGIDAEALLGKSFYPFIHEADRDACIKLIESISSEYPKVKTEARIVLPDGNICWTHWTQIGIFDKRGRLIEYQSVGKDITEQKAAEDALRESEQKYRLIFECADDSISVMDMQGTLLTVNPLACKMLGYTSDELLALSADKIDSRPDEMVANIGKLLENGYYFGETAFVRNDGSTVPVSVNARLIVWEGQPAIMSICRDITELRNAEERLKVTKHKFQTLFERMTDGYAYVDMDGRIEEFNNAFCEMIGYTAEEALLLKYEEITPEKWHTAEREVIEKQVMVRNFSDIYEKEYRRKDGSILPVELRTYLFKDGEGRPRGMWAIIRDISERKHAEEERLNFEKQLLHAQKLESLGVMAGGIAHDFNNLLQSIIGNLELAAKTPGSVPESQEHISYAMNSARQAAQLTNLMLTYVGKGLITRKSLNLNDLVMANVELLRTAASSSVAIELSLSAGLPYINADEAQIQQIIMNLITNGAESIDKPRGCINIITGVKNCDKKYLAASLVDVIPEPGSYVYLEVKDNGCGISNEILKRLFDPFFTTKFTGRGLGMSAVMGILKTHNGALLVESKPGIGSTFRILFPVSKTLVPVKATESAASSNENHIPHDNSLSGAVLVVDDEKSVLRTCAKMIQHIGFKVITALDGLDAIAKYCEHKDEIELVVMDLTMPHMDGLTAMAEIYRIRPDIKVILSSGFSKEELSERFTDNAPSGFIQKPYSISILEAELRRVRQG
jgi:PAS domain S-box-containing protein